MGKKKTDYKITLSNIDGESLLYQHYSQSLNIEKDESYEDTTINFLHEKDKKRKRGVFFIDPQRGHVKLWATMIDFTIAGAIPRMTKRPCWSCRNKFNTQPIGCPVRYNPTPQNPIHANRIKNKFKEMNVPFNENELDFFETEGIFCSFPCVKFYILDQISKTKSTKYKKALEYLSLLYYKITGENIIIPSLSSWKLSVDWGGHLTPSELRASFGNLDYIETVNVMRPYMFCSSNWIKEKKIKL